MNESGRKMKSESYIREAIVQMLTLKLRTGTSIDELRSFTAECIEHARRIACKSAKTQGLDIHRLGSVLRAWHTETRYLTEDGCPRPLKMQGRSSLKTLVRLYYPANKYELVFRRLRAARLVKRHGRDMWLPTGRHARISQLSYETLEHLSEGVARYVETVTSNVTARKEGDVLFERSCKVTRLPASEFASFRDYVAEQAIAFITAIDDWLESRNAPAQPSTRVRTAGVYTFAYIDRNK
jgi:hypothetical protein